MNHSTTNHNGDQTMNNTTNPNGDNAMNNTTNPNGDNAMNNTTNPNGDHTMNNANTNPNGDNAMNNPSPSQTESARNREAFAAQLRNEVQRLCQELSQGGEGLTYTDARDISVRMRAFFLSQLQQVPMPVDAWLEVGEAILAPTTRESAQHLRKVLGLSGGAAGLYLVLSSLASILGWGAGILATFKVWLVGASLSGPIGWGVAGATLLAIAGYICVHDDTTTATERYMKVMTDGVDDVVRRIWNEHGAALSDR